MAFQLAFRLAFRVVFHVTFDVAFDAAISGLWLATLIVSSRLDEEIESPSTEYISIQHGTIAVLFAAGDFMLKHLISFLSFICKFMLPAMARFAALLAVFSFLSYSLVAAQQPIDFEEQNRNARCDNDCFFGSFPPGSCTNDPACMCTQQKYRERYFCCMGEKCSSSVLPDSIQRISLDCEDRNLTFTFDPEAVCGIKLITTLASATPTGTLESTSAASSSTIASQTVPIETQTTAGGPVPTTTPNGASPVRVMLKAAVILVAASEIGIIMVHADSRLHLQKIRHKENIEGRQNTSTDYNSPLFLDWHTSYHTFDMTLWGSKNPLMKLTSMTRQSRIGILLEHLSTRAGRTSTKTHLSNKNVIDSELNLFPDIADLVV
ncbi:hypothetical protein ACJ72_03597 [Emergomyces africanus]|uniref:Extracellular membrane protein CFEM domain-containing protein n=1 Tax=Emergomyces africanus TaxID=1955775 RepID=A0A1B7NZ37_9EURO|nr:hypothetical protein ACJ72_03597 [Emergomyces africanus]